MPDNQHDQQSQQQEHQSQQQEQQSQQQEQQEQLQQQEQQDSWGSASSEQQDVPAPTTPVSRQLQAAHGVLASLLTESGVAAAAATSAGHLHAQGLVSTARDFHKLILQLHPSPEQLLCFREQVCLQHLLQLPADDARLQVLTADVEVGSLVVSQAHQSACDVFVLWCAMIMSRVKARAPACWLSSPL